MSDSETNNAPDAPEVEVILAEFDTKKDILAEFCTKTKGLIEAALQDAKIPYQSVQLRVKSRKKLREKYLDSSKNYKRLDDITDQAGLRVITYYEDEVDKVADVIKREFDVDPVRSIDKRETEPDKFGYYALNYVCRHTHTRAADVEYKKFSDIWCEIQITSILRHAWSEIQHDWYDMKQAFPSDIKRRFARMAALLEIAESEFLDLRKKKSSYLRSVSVQVDAEVPGLLLDAVSLMSFIKQDPAVAVVDQSIAELVQRELSHEVPEANIHLLLKLASCAGFTALKDIRDGLKKHERAIHEYVDRSRQMALAKEEPRSPLPRGVCVFHLAVILIGGRGENVLLDTYREMGVTLDATSTQKVKERAAIAEEVLAKYASGG